MKDLSIIIVNFNNKKLLQECLYSIYQHTHQVTFEIIVVDNNSADGSQEMVRASFPEVNLIANSENLGFIKASNQGLAIFNARYAMLLNDDTIVKEGAFDKMIAFLDQNPRAGACGPKLLNVDGTLQRQGGLFGHKFWRASRPVQVDFVIGACLAVRKEVIDQIGILDENLFFYNDDLDWCLRIRRAGHKIYFLPEAEVVHYGGYSSKRKFNPRLFVEGFIGGLYFCRKHYGELSYNSYRLILILSLILGSIFQIFNRQKFFAYWRIIRLAAVGQIPRPVLK